MPPITWDVDAKDAEEAAWACRSDSDEDSQPEAESKYERIIADEAAKLEVLEAAEDPESEMGRASAMRGNARQAFVQLDNSARYRRALLRKSVPQRGPFPIGCYTAVRRGDTHAPGMRWCGPARVAGHEGARARAACTMQAVAAPAKSKTKRNSARRRLNTRRIHNASGGGPNKIKT